MTEIERELRDLAPLVEWPPTRDFVAAVVAEIGSRTPTRRYSTRSRRRGTLAAVALVLAIVAGVLAVPAARSTLLRVLHLGGVDVEVVDELPSISAKPSDLEAFGATTTMARARQAAGFALLRPSADLGPPDEVRSAAKPVFQVTYVWRDEGGGVRLLVTQFDVAVEPYAGKKIAGSGVQLEFLELFGQPALWIEARHVFVPAGDLTIEAGRLAGRTLLAVRGDVTIRVEGASRKSEAVAIARGLRP
jgi:hypothetical protein